jgi:predicted RNA binding protein YcfA (HicA-like mRNA interferase family)
MIRQCWKRSLLRLGLLSDGYVPSGCAERVLRAFESLGFHLVREGNHNALERQNPDGTRTPLTMPNHRTIKGSTLRMILTQAGIPREDFLRAYEKS